MACPFPCLLEPDPPPHAPFQDRRWLGRLDNHSAVRKLDLLLNLEPVEFFVGENWENRALFAQETFQGRLKALGEEIGEGYSWAHVMGNFPVMVSNEYITMRESFTTRPRSRRMVVKVWQVWPAEEGKRPQLLISYNENVQ